MNSKITFELQLEEAQFIVQVLGQLPTQSNAHPLFVRLAQSLQEQNPKASTDVEIVND